MVNSNGSIAQGVFTHRQASGSKDRVGTDTQAQVGLIPVEVAVVLSELVRGVNKSDRAGGKAGEV